MRARLTDVARRAGVSPKTVSNVVNDYVHVSPETRSRVLAALSELNYTPNLHARNLRKGRTGIIALVIPDLSISYFTDLAQHVIDAAAEHSLTVLIDQTGGLEKRERHIVSGSRVHLVDGLIFSPRAMDLKEIEAVSTAIPMVLLGEPEHPLTMDHIAFDNVAAGQVATRHLIALGRRRIAAVGAKASTKTGAGALRLEGYRRALQEANLPFEEDLVLSPGKYHRTSGAAAMEQLVNFLEPPDAVFFFNDLMAMGGLHELRRRGLRSPEDIAVMGFDDIEEGRFSNPTLTTVSPDKQRIAHAAVEHLFHRLAGKQTMRAHEVLVDFQLIERESTQGMLPILRQRRHAPTPTE